MRKFILLFISMLFITNSFGSGFPYKRENRDMKLNTQRLIEYQLISNPAVAAADDVLTDDAGSISAAIATQSTFDAAIDVPRNVSITPTGTTTDVESCVVVVDGTDFHNQVITENFTFAANASTATVGNKAFKTVTLITWPANCESGAFAATWDVGYGEKLGLKRCMALAGHLVFSTVSGVYETTRATVAVDASNIEGNTLDFNGTMDGAADFEVFFIQNFAQTCFP